MSRTYHHGDKAKQRAFKKHWRWLGSYPGWWDTLFHHRPRRQEERRLCRLAERGVDDGVWPLGRKPHKYYW